MMASAHLVAAFVIFAFFSEIPRTSAQSNVNDYFDQMEADVKELARKLGEIFSSPCGNDPSCPNGCSQSMCQQLANNLPISYINASASVTRSNSSVTYFSYGGQDQPSDVESSSICRTQLLDETFQNVSSKVNYYLDYYVGLIDGTRRAYPGREEQQDSCLLYDSRIRPWYSGAITYPNHLVILVDIGHSMTDPLKTAPSGLDTKLHAAQNFSLALLSTAYKDNYINVVSFGGAQNDSYTRSLQVGFNYDNPSIHKELATLNLKILNFTNQTSVLNTDVTAFVTGLNTTLRAFSDSTLPNAQLYNLSKNIVLFTDGSFASQDILNDPSVVAAIAELQAINVNLFVYSDELSVGLQSLTAEMNGSYTVWASNDNPLHEMRSYFGYLAASHRNLFNDTPFWIDNYRDAYNISDIITVSMPAFDQDKFVGVAAIDVPFPQLPRDDMNNLGQRRTTRDNTLESASSSTRASSVPPIFDDYNCGTSGSMCQGPPQESFNKEAFQDRKCRNLCADQEDNKVKEIVIGTVVGAIFAAAVFGTGAFLCMRRRKKEARERGSSGTTNVDARITGVQEEAKKPPSETWGDPL
ncbi:hypothetical protein AXG93_560s1000 [Marchantia polymorpha subsp. ruderalis]|uniref:VWFA domain-containing protein n=1 Tax=Marchantia polymorpha subsp. ruderalis TaxID=1480154 RepID=A0A176VKG5_MARPO|nr:hypothetical protein AXG93_560s1000 [Marchantia polymorpha subsp. ruderalis]